MATSADASVNFFQGLSDLWVRFFVDHEQIKAIYDGVQILAGQAYLNLLSGVLNASIRETPIFEKEFFRLLTVREDLVELRSTDMTYVFEVTEQNLKDFNQLCNRIYGPTVILEKGIDFEIENHTPSDLDRPSEDLVVFCKNPFDWDGDGSNKTPPGVPYRTVEVVADDGTTSQERELAFWIPDAQVDRYDLYLNYGYLLNRFEPSSEAYRALLQGIIQYFVLGPTKQHMTSALNVILGLPVIREDGEILQGIDLSDPLKQIVQTDKANYEFAAGIPLRADVLDPANWGTLSFNAFEHLTTVFEVVDSVEDPTWYYDITIPAVLLPDEGRARRTISPVLYENRIGHPEGLVCVGDPGFIIGRDDDGAAVPGTSTREPYRHLFSYIVFERYLRHHIFAVLFDTDVILSGDIPFPRFLTDIQSIVIPGKSAYTMLYAEPGLVFEGETAYVSESLTITVV